MKTVLLSSFLLIFFNYLKANEDFNFKAKYIVDNYSQLDRNDLDWSKSIPFRINENVTLGYNANATVWIRFSIENQSKIPFQKYLSFNNIYIDSLTLFNNNRSILIGDRTNEMGPFLNVLAFPIYLKEGQKKAFLVRLKKNISFVEFKVNIENGEKLNEQSQNRILVVSFFIGIIFLLFIINSILLFQTKLKLYLFYLIYSFLTSGYILISTGMAKYFIFSEVLIFSELRIYFGTLWLISLGVFLAEFLRLSEFQPKLMRWIRRLVIINLVVITLSIFFLLKNNGDALKYFTLSAYTIFLCLILLLFIASIKHVKIQRLSGLYALAAFFPLIAWGAIFIFNVFGWIKYEPSVDLLSISGLFEVFLFGFVLTRNYIEAFRNEARLQKEILAQRAESFEMVQKAQMKERKQIAHVIHDRFVGSLSALELQLNKVESQEAITYLRSINTDLRALSHNIMPKSLEEGDLISAIKTHSNTLNKIHNFSLVEVYAYESPSFYPEEIALPIYLVVLELVQNAQKHGGATKIIIEFYSYSEVFVFQVIDNGKGFDFNEGKNGFGIRSIISRIETLNGEIEFESKISEGTHIQISIPNKNTHK